MLRTLIAATLIAAPAMAEDAIVTTRVDAALIYAQGAAITRTGAVDLPSGTHRLLMPFPRGGDIGNAEISVDGAAITAISSTERLPVSEGDLLTEEQSAAIDARDSLIEELAAQDDAIAALEARIDGQTARIAYLERLDSAAAGDPAATATLIADGVSAARAEIAAQSPALRALRQERGDIADLLQRAEITLAALTPLAAGTGGMIATITLEEAATVPVEIRYLANAAGWLPTYDIRLDTETNALTVDRSATVQQRTGEAWRDVELTLSTEQFSGRTTPTQPNIDIARIFEPQQFEPELLQEDRIGRQARSMEVSPEIAQSDFMEAAPEFQGMAVSYRLPARVDIAPVKAITRAPEDGTRIALGTITPDAEVELRAAPRTDTTAFLVVAATNTSEEPLIPGPAILWRDGAIIGGSFLPVWAPGSETEIGFGAVETVQLEMTVLQQGTGDAGIISRSSTRRTEVRFSVENTGGTARDVRVFYALPVSEQEDLEIDVTADPDPAERSADDRRGVAVWDMSLAAGESQDVALTFEFDWPEGQALMWEP